MADDQRCFSPDKRTRRAFLRGAGLAAGALAGGWRESLLAQVTGVTGRETQVKYRPDLLDDRSPKGLEVIQVTTEPDVPSSHLYMEAQVFTMDSKCFVLHRSASAHGGSKDDPQHQYLLCDIEDDCALSPLATELGVTAASLSPDDRYCYYFVDETEVNGGRLILKRVKLDGTARETIAVVDSALPGTSFRPSEMYPLSTVSSDGNRIAISCFLGDGNTEAPPWGLMVFDIGKASVNLIIHGPSWCNMHPQYCRSKHRHERRDILLQENHDNITDARGKVTRLVGGDGADIHVIRDDGANFRNLPWGRDGNEACQGHQCWRGRSTWAITSTGLRQPSEAQLIEGRAAPYAGHVGLKTPGTVRNDLSQEFPSPHFYHFGTDIQGKRIVSDAGPFDTRASVYLAELGEPGRDAARDWQYLLTPRSSCDKGSHIHPFLSPDGKMALFNSDESGILQAYMIRGL